MRLIKTCTEPGTEAIALRPYRVLVYMYIFIFILLEPTNIYIYIPNYNIYILMHIQECPSGIQVLYIQVVHSLYTEH